ncbi:MAG TPA: TfoX/Sxy family protein [Thermoanaerobaculia bacterium]|nr:TfoX/Sxy family protein [Thermoanaerobaculia bacterium]
MAFSEALAARIREVLGRHKGVTERKMFGGLAFLLNGNMCCGVIGDRLMLRLGKDGAAEALSEPHTRSMDFTGKPMKSMVYVDPAGLPSEEALRKWVWRAVAYVSSLPSKV